MDSTEHVTQDKNVFDVVSAADFENLVLAQSQTRPVVVDFWAPWCGPCRHLGPVLEALAAEAKGAWCLAKLDIDTLPSIAQQFRVSSIPAVKCFSKGEVINEFVGALPEHRLRAWLEGILPGPEEDAMQAAQAHEAQGALDEAQAAYEDALSHRPLHPPAIVGLARIALQKGDRDAAQQHLQSIIHVDDEDLEREIAGLRLVLSQDDNLNLTELLKLANDNPTDLELRLKLGHTLAAHGRHEEALKSFLSIIESSRSGPGEQAREAMIQLFSVVGMHSELATRYRSALSQLLFS